MFSQYRSHATIPQSKSIDNAAEINPVYLPFALPLAKGRATNSVLRQTSALLALASLKGAGLYSNLEEDQGLTSSVPATTSASLADRVQERRPSADYS
jgi:hypothetical protein